jgi:hypothetical protein
MTSCLQRTCLTVKLIPVHTMQQIIYSVKNYKKIYNYWYHAVATYFGLSLDHLQANVHK